MPGVDIRILDDDGNDVAHGSPGEIAIRAPQVMANYWNRPDETAKAMTADGYFKSGDIVIRAIQTADIGVRHGPSFAVMSDALTPGF